MKKIVKGNDFTLKIPVMKMVEGQAKAFPLPACTDVVVQVCNQFNRIPLAFEIDVKEDNVLLARVEGDKMGLGTYAIEVKGKIFGNDWRSNEYPQFAIVANNADADTEFGTTDEGDNSVEMDTAMVILPPSVELSDLISDTNEALGKVDGAISKTDEAVKKANDAVSQVNGALKKVQNVDIDIDGTDLNITRPSGEKKEFDLMQLKGDKGERGEKGDKGDKGEKGDKGLQGERGEQGLQGIQGEQGMKGDTGAQGEQGIQGVKGDPFTYDDFTEAEIKELQKPAIEAASKAQEILKKAEAATADAEKVDATLVNDVLTVTNRNGENTSLQLASYAEVGEVVSEVKHLSETMGAYSDRPDITLVAKETNKAISSDGVKVTKAGWAIAEFTAEKGNVYLFKPNVIDESVCIFAEYIQSVETRGIDYTYTYNPDGTTATATATYLGVTHTYTFTYAEDKSFVITDETGDAVNELPMVYETKVGTYSPLVSLNADAELPKDGYCRYMSHFKGNSAIKVVVSYKVGVADLTMKVTRDGVLASISTQLGNLSQKEDETRKKIDELHGSYVDLVFYDVWDKLVVDGKTITVIKGQKMRLYPTNSFSLENKYLRDVCPLAFADVSHLDTSHFTTFEYMFKNCRNADIIGLENLNTGSVTSMESMFQGCSSLTTLNINGWNTGSVTSMASMFHGCSSLTTLNISSFNGRKLKTGPNAYQGGIGFLVFQCGNLKTLDMGGDDWCFDSMENNSFNFYRWLDNSSVSSLTLGKNWFKAEFTPGYFVALSKWNKESVRLSLVTNSYDRKANGLTDKTITLHANVKKLLSEDDIAAMTAKGYIIA